MPVIKTINVKVETRNVIDSTANSTLTIAESIEYLMEEIKLYEQDGYTITNVNPEGLTFTATKTI